MNTEKKLLCALIFIFFLISITGIKWGVPSQSINNLYFYNPSSIKQHIQTMSELSTNLPRSFYNSIRSYHPDEYFIIKTLQSIKLPLLKFSLEQFSIGFAYLYLYGFLLLLLSLTGFIHLERDITYYFLNPEEIAKFYITGRTISLIYGLGIVLLTYIITKKISKNKSAAFLSGLFLIFSPLFLMNTHYMYVDIPGIFWIMLTIYLSVKYLDGEKISPFFIGISAGMSAANKITFLLTFFIPFFTFLIDDKIIREKIRNIVYSFLSFIGILIVIYPFFLTSLHHLFQGEGQHATKICFAPDFYITSLRYGIGTIPFFFLALGMFFIILKGKDKKVVIVLSWTFFFFIGMSSLTQKFARYILPVLPPFIILGVLGWFSLKNLALFIKNFVFALTIIFIFLYGMAYEMLFIKENIRTEAGIWIKENIPPGSSIGVTEVPWQFQLPPFDYYTYKVEVTGYNIEELKKRKPEYFILSSFQAPVPPYPMRLQKERVEFYKEFIESELYAEEKKFEKYPSFAGIIFKIRQLPEDLIYLNPSIVVFKKKGK